MEFTDSLLVLVFLSGFLALYTLYGRLSSRTQNKLNRLLSGGTEMWTGQETEASSEGDAQKTIQELRERLEVLEKIVTDQAYELDRKIAGLK